MTAGWITKSGASFASIVGLHMEKNQSSIVWNHPLDSLKVRCLRVVRGPCLEGEDDETAAVGKKE